MSAWDSKKETPCSLVGLTLDRASITRIPSARIRIRQCGGSVGNRVPKDRTKLQGNIFREPLIACAGSHQVVLGVRRERLIVKAGGFIDDGLAIKHVIKATVQPSFTGHCIVSTVDEFIEHVRVVASKPLHFLLQPNADLRH